MDHILIIDTTIRYLSLSLIHIEKGDSYNYEDVNEENSHAKKINIAIQKLLLDANIGIENLVAVAVNEGPGSFTGLRVGSSTAKGLCFALDVPLISINGLYAYGQCLREMKQNEEASDIFVLMDARRENYYYAHLNHEHSESKALFDSIQNIKTKIRLCHRPFIYYIDKDNHLELSAKDLRKSAINKWREKQFQDIRSFEPIYIVNNYAVKR